MIVEEIIPLDKRRSRVLFDEGSVLALYGGELRRYHIFEGNDITEELYHEIIEKVLYRRARERMAYLLKASSKTEQEIRKKLEEGFYPEEAINYAVEFGIKHHYIDDREYARYYIERNTERKSRKQIVFELQRKGIEKELLEELLEDAPVAEENQIRKLLLKKRYDKDQMDFKEKQKVMASIVRKGYSYELVSHIMGSSEEFG